MTPKETFISLASGITRNGIENLMHFLEYESDFYTAPCSTRYHLSVPGGLVIHSIHVYKLLEIKARQFKLNVDPETLLICGLFHDVCKTNFYDIEKKWRKNDRNQWEQYDAYVIKDLFPAGHGSKSVSVLQKYLHLTDEEILSVMWHMGAWTEGMTEYSMRQAYNAAGDKYPLVTALHLADLEATRFIEREQPEEG
jgi:putative nucleotidyltransferase with HDIG domain